MTTWDPDAVESLVDNRTGAREFDPRDAEQVRDAVITVLRENADLAARRIVNIALYDPNVRLSLDASKYIIEQVKNLEGGEGDRLHKTLMDILSEDSSGAAE
jgi:hypothetical protein